MPFKQLQEGLIVFSDNISTALSEDQEKVCRVHQNYLVALNTSTQWLLSQWETTFQWVSLFSYFLKILNRRRHFYAAAQMSTHTQLTLFRNKISKRCTVQYG